MMTTEEDMVCAHCGKLAEESGGMPPLPGCFGHPIIPRSRFVRKPYESPKVTDGVIGIVRDRLLFAEALRHKLRQHFEASPKTSFGLGDIYEGIDKVLLGR